MSSRVLKGGLVFKPVVKSRSGPRTVPSASRQASDLETHNTGISAEYDAPPSNSRNATEASGDATTHSESSKMVDGSNSIPIVNPTSLPIYPRPPLISSSSNNFILTPSSLSVTENLELWPSTIDSIVSGVVSQRNQSNVQATTVQSANVAASTSTTLTASSTTPPSNEDVVSDPSASRKRPSKPQSNSPKGKKRKASSDEGGDDEIIQDDLPPKQRRTRASSGTPRPRRRVPTPLPYDPNGDPGEDIDPTSVTMAALCTDTGQGRVSRKAAEILANHAAWKAKNKEKRAHMRNLMELKKYGREEGSEHDQDGAQAQPVEDATSPSNPGTSNAPATAPVLDDTGNGFDYSQGLATSRYNVQVRIGPNGETVIDEESLVVDRVGNDGTDDYTHVIESDHTKFVNSGTYGKRYRSSRWSAEETERFFDALSQYGENYELIAYVLPGRDRKSCKNKFKVEDKRNHARIDHCLNNSIPVDMVTLARMTGKDFSGPVPEIRVPPQPIPTVAPRPSQQDIDSQNDVTPQQHSKKRSRSKSQLGVEDDVIVVGDVDSFQN